VKVLTGTFKPIGPPFEAVAALDSDLLSPTYHCHARLLPAALSAGGGGAGGSGSALTSLPSMLRLSGGASGGAGTSATFTTHYVRLPDAQFDPSATLVIRVDTLESHSHTLQVAGYAVFNLFAYLRGTSDSQPGVVPPPVGVRESDLVLNAGAFQLPLHQVPPSRTNPLTAKCLEASPRVPCATICLRVGRLPGATAYAANPTAIPVPVAMPPPAYKTQAYDSGRCRPAPAEVLLYPKRCEITAPRAGELLDHYASKGQELGM
jgi:hypothetical protein